MRVTAHSGKVKQTKEGISENSTTNIGKRYFEKLTMSNMPINNHRQIDLVEKYKKK